MVDFKHIGLGFRRDIHQEIIDLDDNKPAFIELAPENWMKFGGYWKEVLDKVRSKYKIFTHGLSLSIGSPDELDYEFLKDLKKFFSELDIQIYSEHLSYSKCDNAHIYDLLPIPFREDAVKHIVKRIKEAQDILERKIALENVSYYTPVGAEMTELEFISAIINESGCDMLLDVNNVYVNAFNHDYNPKKFLDGLPLDKVKYIHMAGHLKVDEDTIIDTHGEDIIDPVYVLLNYVAPKLKPVPILLERDFNIPSIDKIQSEMKIMEDIVSKHWEFSFA